ncbi:orotate phosphoribosyltransferase [Natronoflexus pectinivorans]|uniref:Orotate phosphoribosyltransferase n=1 Tax=Natronoflexus pectinivorans TaxID=682526 RepID=A0A4R2GNF5_9BACT|nr:orotate phosphoribosyltransferase [Natronoflexus pectinivorans]TCO10567.1 orotate phosphoribosyltransferase [Natronoflexus pectinivorans]
MKKTEETIASHLLQIKAIKLQPANPFTWASGWISPIYCDNRKTLSYPEVRDYIKNAFAEIIKEKFADADVIAGVATGAIAQGALVADILKKPFIYVRSSPKGHGLENLIEGDLKPGQKVVIIEDLISTGGSSLKAAEAVRNGGGDILGMLAIFSYGFSVAEENFRKENVELQTLSNYQTLLKVAVSNGNVTADHLETLDAWRKDPANWNK